MKYLTKLIEVSRNEGFWIAKPIPGSTAAPIPQLYQVSPLEWDLFSKVQPFIFSDEAPLNMKEFLTPEIRDDRLSKWKAGLDTETDLDAPFKVFSIEYLNSHLDEFVSADGKEAKTYCVLVVEVEPKQYGYYTLTYADGFGWMIHKSNSEGTLLKHVLNRLNKEQLGMENTRQSIKLGTGKAKQIHRIRKIIHVAPYKSIGQYGAGSRQVDWTQHWSVRGHWRKIEGLGKDRADNYCISNFTWVREHEKGPKELPLVNKPRLVR